MSLANLGSISPAEISSPVNVSFRAKLIVYVSAPVFLAIPSYVLSVMDVSLIAAKYSLPPALPLVNTPIPMQGVPLFIVPIFALGASDFAAIQTPLSNDALKYIACE